MNHRVSNALIIAALFITPSVFAANGGCPVGQEGKNPLTPPGVQKGVVEVHLNAEMPLGDQAINAPGWRFRSRTITIGPGAVIPLHSHDQRPETPVMKHGSVTIYETDCKVGYVMKEGDVYQSGRGKSHWAVNETDHYAVMYVVDLVKDDSFPVQANNQ